jgi:hypothetical protein
MKKNLLFVLMLCFVTSFFSLGCEDIEDDEDAKPVTIDFTLRKITTDSSGVKTKGAPVTYRSRGFKFSEDTVEDLVDTYFDDFDDDDIPVLAGFPALPTGLSVKLNFNKNKDSVTKLTVDSLGTIFVIKDLNGPYTLPADLSFTGTVTVKEFKLNDTISILIQGTITKGTETYEITASGDIPFAAEIIDEIID